MLFSICIPVYNTSKYLRACLESVLSQTLTDFEIVLIDDGSTDESADICDEYAEKYSNVRVVHKQNEGLMMTRRRGFQEAKGEYVICLDSDDYYCRTDFLEKVKELIVTKKCDLVIFNYIAGKEEKANDKSVTLLDAKDGVVFEGENKKLLYEYFLNGKGLNAIWCKAIARKNVDVDVDYSVWKQDICRAEDRFQSMPILNNAQRIGYIKEPMLYYRWTEGSISNSPKLKYYYAFRTIFKREDEYIEKWKLDERVIQKRVMLRIETILGIIIPGYHALKAEGKIAEWEKFMQMVSDDSFFIEMIPQKYKKEVSLYYRVLHQLIVSKNWVALKLVLNSYRFYREKIKKVIGGKK